ncbi:MAG: hypothetical protein R2737_18525 [Candidatus Nanopelagicales bacterium]
MLATRSSPRAGPADRQVRDRLAASPALRTARGAVLGLVVVGLSVGAHGSAGGHIPLGTLAVATVVAVALGIALSGREWTVVGLLAFLAATQVLLHYVLEASMPMHAGTGTATPAHDHAGMGMPGTAMPGTQVPMPGMASSSPVAAATMPDAGASGSALDGAVGLSGLMLLAHVAAVVVAAVALRYGEDAVLAVVTLLLAPLRRRPGVAVDATPAPPRPHPVGWEPIGGRSALVAFSVRRRGPPVPALAGPWPAGVTPRCASLATARYLRA